MSTTIPAAPAAMQTTSSPRSHAAATRSPHRQHIAVPPRSDPGARSRSVPGYPGVSCPLFHPSERDDRSIIRSKVRAAPLNRITNSITPTTTAPVASTITQNTANASASISRFTEDSTLADPLLWALERKRRVAVQVVHLQFLHKSGLRCASSLSAGWTYLVTLAAKAAVMPGKVARMFRLARPARRRTTRRRMTQPDRVPQLVRQEVRSHRRRSGAFRRQRRRGVDPDRHPVRRPRCRPHAVLRHVHPGVVVALGSGLRAGIVLRGVVGLQVDDHVPRSTGADVEADDVDIGNVPFRRRHSAVPSGRAVVLETDLPNPEVPLLVRARGGRCHDRPE
jgi:hypothetical protein